MKRNKLFGIFNIVDILLILIVIIVGIVGGRMLLGGRGAAESGADTKTYSYVVMGEEVVAETANFPVVGGNAYESSTSTYLGTVKDVKTEPFTETMFNRTTGKYEKVPVDGYSNIYVTIEGNGTETEKDITVEGTTVKVGMELNVKGKGYAFKGIVVEVVVVALCAVAVFKFGVVNQKESAGVDDSEEQRTYTALIDEVRMATVNALHEGDKIYDEKTGICLGTITAVKHEPFLKNVLLNDGTIQPVEFPDYYSVTLTIDGPVVEKDEGYFVDGVVEMKANSEMNVATKYAKPVMKITSISE